MRERPAVVLDRPLGESLLSACCQPFGREDVEGRLLAGLGDRGRVRLPPDAALDVCEDVRQFELGAVA